MAATIIQTVAASVFLFSVLYDGYRRIRLSEEERRDNIIKALHQEWVATNPIAAKTAAEYAGIFSERQIEFFNQRLQEIGEPWRYPFQRFRWLPIIHINWVRRGSGLMRYILRRPRAFWISVCNLVGLLCSIIGVLLLVYFALPVKPPGAGSFLATSGFGPDWEAAVRRYDWYAHIGLVLVVIGTAFEAVPPFCTAIGSWRRRP
jgi:hypothetical protein